MAFKMTTPKAKTSQMADMSIRLGHIRIKPHIVKQLGCKYVELGWDPETDKIMLRKAPAESGFKLTLVPSQGGIALITCKSFLQQITYFSRTVRVEVESIEHGLLIGQLDKATLLLLRQDEELLHDRYLDDVEAIVRAGRVDVKP